MGQILRKMLNKQVEDDHESHHPSPIITDDNRDDFGLYAERPTLQREEHSRNLLGDKVKKLESATKYSDESDPELTGLLQDHDQDDRKELESKGASKEDEDLGFTVDIDFSQESFSGKDSCEEVCKCKEGESCICGDDCQCGDDCHPLE